MQARYIAVVYDDSGSMRYRNNRDSLKNYIYANYSLQNLVALMDEHDMAQVFLISKKGKNPITVKKRKDLFKEFRGVVAVKAGNTYADTIAEAFRAGADFLDANTGGEFLFVYITDGETLYSPDGKEIKGSLRDLFGGYVRKNGLDDKNRRISALLLSIGSGKLLTPVSDMAAVLSGSGISTRTFKADISNEARAGDTIIAAMKELAEAMAGTYSMAIEPGKPFTMRYPLDSLVIMEQFQHASASMIKSIADGGGHPLNRSTLYTTRAIGGVNLASTFTSVKSPNGFVMPGEYKLESSGKVKLLAFPKAGFGVGITFTDAGGLPVASYQSGKWSVGSLSLQPGERLAARAALTARDGTEVEIGTAVAITCRAGDIISFTSGERGLFTLTGSKPGKAYLEVSLADPEFFQIDIAPIECVVREPAATASPVKASATPASQTPAATQAALAVPVSAAPSASTAAQPSPAAVRASGQSPVKRVWPIARPQIIVPAAMFLLIAAAYCLALASKKRIPMEIEAYASANDNMALAVRVPIGRDMLKRKFWPFGREVCTVGLLELYPHGSDRSLVILSSECVQYGLRIDGRPPQFHKLTDRIGDYVIGENNIVGVREDDGAYHYYRFVYNDVSASPGK